MLDPPSKLLLVFIPLIFLPASKGEEGSTGLKAVSSSDEAHRQASQETYMRRLRGEGFDFAAEFDEIVGEITENFTCLGKSYGYYADQSTDCKVFHICSPLLTSTGTVVKTYMFSFFCPEKTRFSQDSRTCIAEDYAFPCGRAHSLYELNDLFGRLPSDDLSKQFDGKSSRKDFTESNALLKASTDSSRLGVSVGKISFPFDTSSSVKTQKTSSLQEVNAKTPVSTKSFRKVVSESARLDDEPLNEITPITEIVNTNQRTPKPVLLSNLNNAITDQKEHLSGHIRDTVSHNPVNPATETPAGRRRVELTIASNIKATQNAIPGDNLSLTLNNGNVPSNPIHPDVHEAKLFNEKHRFKTDTGKNVQLDADTALGTFNSPQNSFSINNQQHFVATKTNSNEKHLFNTQNENNTGENIQFIHNGKTHESKEISIQPEEAVGVGDTSMIVTGLINEDKNISIKLNQPEVNLSNIKEIARTKKIKSDFSHPEEQNEQAMPKTILKEENNNDFEKETNHNTASLDRPNEHDTAPINVESEILTSTTSGKQHSSQSSQSEPTSFGNKRKGSKRRRVLNNSNGNIADTVNELQPDTIRNSVYVPNKIGFENNGSNHRFNHAVATFSPLDPPEVMLPPPLLINTSRSKSEILNSVSSAVEKSNFLRNNVGTSNYYLYSSIDFDKNDANILESNNFNRKRNEESKSSFQTDALHKTGIPTKIRRKNDQTRTGNETAAKQQTLQSPTSTETSVGPEGTHDKSQLIDDLSDSSLAQDQLYLDSLDSFENVKLLNNSRETNNKEESSASQSNNKVTISDFSQRSSNSSVQQSLELENNLQNQRRFNVLKPFEISIPNSTNLDILSGKYDGEYNSGDTDTNPKSSSPSQSEVDFKQSSRRRLSSRSNAKIQKGNSRNRVRDVQSVSISDINSALLNLDIKIPSHLLNEQSEKFEKNDTDPSLDNKLNQFGNARNFTVNRVIQIQQTNNITHKENGNGRKRIRSSNRIQGLSFRNHDNGVQASKLSYLNDSSIEESNGNENNKHQPYIDRGTNRHFTAKPNLNYVSTSTVPITPRTFTTTTFRPVSRERGSKKFEPSTYLLDNYDFGLRINPRLKNPSSAINDGKFSSHVNTNSQTKNIRNSFKASKPGLVEDESVADKEDGRIFLKSSPLQTTSLVANNIFLVRETNTKISNNISSLPVDNTFNKVSQMKINLTSQKLKNRQLNISSNEKLSLTNSTRSTVDGNAKVNKEDENEHKIQNIPQSFLKSNRQSLTLNERTVHNSQVKPVMAGNDKDIQITREEAGYIAVAHTSNTTDTNQENVLNDFNLKPKVHLETSRNLKISNVERHENKVDLSNNVNTETIHQNINRKYKVSDPLIRNTEEIVTTNIEGNSHFSIVNKQQNESPKIKLLQSGHLSSSTVKDSALNSVKNDFTRTQPPTQNNSTEIEKDISRSSKTSNNLNGQKSRRITSRNRVANNVNDNTSSFQISNEHNNHDPSFSEVEKINGRQNRNQSPSSNSKRRNIALTNVTDQILVKHSNNSLISPISLEIERESSLALRRKGNTNTDSYTEENENSKEENTAPHKLLLNTSININPNTNHSFNAKLIENEESNFDLGSGINATSITNKNKEALQLRRNINVIASVGGTALNEEDGTVNYKSNGKEHNSLVVEHKLEKQNISSKPNIEESSSNYLVNKSQRSLLVQSRENSGIIESSFSTSTTDTGNAEFTSDKGIKLAIYEGKHLGSKSMEDIIKESQINIDNLKETHIRANVGIINNQVKDASNTESNDARNGSKWLVGSPIVANEKEGIAGFGVKTIALTSGNADNTASTKILLGTKSRKRVVTETNLQGKNQFVEVRAEDIQKSVGSNETLFIRGNSNEREAPNSSVLNSLKNSDNKDIKANGTKEIPNNVKYTPILNRRKGLNSAVKLEAKDIEDREGKSPNNTVVESIENLNRVSTVQNISRRRSRNKVATPKVEQPIFQENNFDQVSIVEEKENQNISALPKSSSRRRNRNNIEATKTENTNINEGEPIKKIVPVLNEPHGLLSTTTKNLSRRRGRDKIIISLNESTTLPDVNTSVKETKETQFSTATSPKLPRRINRNKVETTTTLPRGDISIEEDIVVENEKKTKSTRISSRGKAKNKAIKPVAEASILQDEGLSLTINPNNTEKIQPQARLIQKSSRNRSRSRGHISRHVGSNLEESNTHINTEVDAKVKDKQIFPEVTNIKPATILNLKPKSKNNSLFSDPLQEEPHLRSRTQRVEQEETNDSNYFSVDTLDIEKNEDNVKQYTLERNTNVVSRPKPIAREAINILKEDHLSPIHGGTNTITVGNNSKKEVKSIKRKIIKRVENLLLNSTQGDNFDAYSDNSNTKVVRPNVNVNVISNNLNSSTETNAKIDVALKDINGKVEYVFNKNDNVNAYNETKSDELTDSTLRNANHLNATEAFTGKRVSIRRNKEDSSINTILAKTGVSQEEVSLTTILTEEQENKNETRTNILIGNVGRQRGRKRVARINLGVRSNGNSFNEVIDHKISLNNTIVDSLNIDVTDIPKDIQTERLQGSRLRVKANSSASETPLLIGTSNALTDETKLQIPSSVSKTSGQNTRNPRISHRRINAQNPLSLESTNDTKTAELLNKTGVTQKDDFVVSNVVRGRSRNSRINLQNNIAKVSDNLNYINNTQNKTEDENLELSSIKNKTLIVGEKNDVHKVSSTTLEEVSRKRVNLRGSRVNIRRSNTESTVKGLSTKNSENAITTEVPANKENELEKKADNVDADNSKAVSAKNVRLQTGRLRGRRINKQAGNNESSSNLTTITGAKIDELAKANSSASNNEVAENKENLPEKGTIAASTSQIGVLKRSRKNFIRNNIIDKNASNKLTENEVNKLLKNASLSAEHDADLQKQQILLLNTKTIENKEASGDSSRGRIKLRGRKVSLSHTKSQNSTISHLINADKVEVSTKAVEIEDTKKNSSSDQTVTTQRDKIRNSRINRRRGGIDSSVKVQTSIVANDEKSKLLLVDKKEDDLTKDKISTSKDEVTTLTKSISRPRNGLRGSRVNLSRNPITAKNDANLESSKNIDSLEARNNGTLQSDTSFIDLETPNKIQDFNGITRQRGTVKKRKINSNSTKETDKLQSLVNNDTTKASYKQGTKAIEKEIEANLSVHKQNAVLPAIQNETNINSHSFERVTNNLSKSNFSFNSILKQIQSTSERQEQEPNFPVISDNLKPQPAFIKKSPAIFDVFSQVTQPAIGIPLETTSFEDQLRKERVNLFSGKTDIFSSISQRVSEPSTGIPLPVPSGHTGKEGKTSFSFTKLSSEEDLRIDAFSKAGYLPQQKLNDEPKKSYLPISTVSDQTFGLPSIKPNTYLPSSKATGPSKFNYFPLPETNEQASFSYLPEIEKPELSRKGYLPFHIIDKDSEEDFDSKEKITKASYFPFSTIKVTNSSAFLPSTNGNGYLPLAKTNSSLPVKQEVLFRKGYLPLPKVGKDSEEVDIKFKPVDIDDSNELLSSKLHKKSDIFSTLFPNIGIPLPETNSKISNSEIRTGQNTNSPNDELSGLNLRVVGTSVKSSVSVLKDGKDSQTKSFPLFDTKSTSDGSASSLRHTALTDLELNALKALTYVNEPLFSNDPERNTYRKEFPQTIKRKYISSRKL